MQPQKVVATLNTFISDELLGIRIMPWLYVCSGNMKMVYVENFLICGGPYESTHRPELLLRGDCQFGGCLAKTKNEQEDLERGCSII